MSWPSSVMSHSTTPTPTSSRGSSRACRTTRVGRLPRSACHRNIFSKSRVGRKDVGVSGESETVSMSVSWNAAFKLEFHGTDTDTDAGMRPLCNFVNVYTITYCVQYTFTRVHARIPNGHPREDPREEKRASDKSADSRRGSSYVSGSWQAERGSRRTRRHPRDDPRAEVGEDVRVSVGVGARVRVGAVEFQLYWPQVFYVQFTSPTR